MNKERTILYLFSINAIIYIASGFYTPFLSAYYAQKGIDAEKIGILLMIGPCVVLLTQRFWAKISDRTGKRKEVLLVTIVGSGFSMLLYYLGNSFLCMFFATVVVTSFTTAVIPLSDAILIARSLKEGYSYSIIRLGGTLGYAVMTICAGMYLKTRPQMQFVFAFFAYMILFCFCIGLKEERNGQIVINEVVQENEQNRIFKNRDVYIVLGLAFVSQMGLSFYTGFIGPYILEKGYTQSTIGVINSISALSEVPVLFYINRMLRKHGTIKILFLSCFLMGIRILLPIRSGIIGIVLAQLLQGVTYMTMYYSCAVSIPVGVHLDHSVTYEIAVGGIRDGFPSVMIDGSTKSFQENVELTKNVVRVAKVFGVDVEAELGHVGNGDSIDAIDNTNYYTKVEDAVRFVEQTGCDSLAIAVGNAHGPYVKTPNLDLERIYAIRKKVNIPLVLHGCSDIPEEQMKEAVNLGMSKFNIATEYFRTMYQSIEKRINNQEFEGNGVKLMYDIKEEMIDFVIQKIRLLNPNKYSM